MSSNSSSFVGDIPSHYDAGLGPNIFFDYAELLTKRCGEINASNIVELAAGTGIVSRRLRDTLSSDARLVVTDLNMPMLDVAKEKFSDADKVEFTIANAMDLPFEDSEFDLIVCQFGVMFFPDKTASYREAARVLRSGGHYLFNVWGSLGENPFSQMAHDVCEKFFPDDPPGFYKVPFHYGNPADVRADLDAAGWRDVEHETIQLTKTVENPDAFATALVYGNPLIQEIRERGGVDPDEVVAAMRNALQSTFGPTPLDMPLVATTYICRAS
jgi:SAM-dependent methyltransferase